MVRGTQSRALLSIHGVQCVRGQTWESRVESGQEMKVGCWCFGPCSVRLELELKGQTVPHTSLEKPSYITGDCCWLGLKNLYRSERDWGLQTHSGASGAPHRCANNSFFFFHLGLNLSDGFWGPGGTAPKSAVAAEQIGKQTVTLGHSHTPLSAEAEPSGGGRGTISHMLC